MPNYGMDLHIGVQFVWLNEGTDHEAEDKFLLGISPKVS